MMLTRKPRIGDKIKWPNNDKVYTVMGWSSSSPDAIANTQAAGDEVTCFIYFFSREQAFNKLASFVDTSN